MGMKKPVKPQIRIIDARRPDVVLKETINKKRWFEGVALSVVFLEEESYYRLRRYLTNKKVIAHPFLERMNLSRMAKILERLQIINHKTHSLIGEINKYRNKIVHEYRTPDAIKPEDAKQIIEKTLKCLEAIFSSYELKK